MCPEVRTRSDEGVNQNFLFRFFFRGVWRFWVFVLSLCFFLLFFFTLFLQLFPAFLESVIDLDHGYF